MSAANRQNAISYSVLVVGDDSRERALLANLLRAENLTVDLLPVSALDTIASCAVYSQGLIVLLSADHPDQDLAQLTEFAAQNNSVRFVVLDGNPTVARAVQSMKIGATDYLDLSDGEMDLAPFLTPFPTDFEIPAIPDSKFGTIGKLGVASEPPGADFNNHLQKLVNASHFLASCDSLSALCEGLMSILGGTVGAAGGSLYLMDGDMLKCAHSLDPGHAPQTIQLPLKKGCIFETVLSSNEPLLLSDIDQINEIRVSGWKGYVGNSLLVYPLVEKWQSHRDFFTAFQAR